MPQTTHSFCRLNCGLTYSAPNVCFVNAFISCILITVILLSILGEKKTKQKRNKELR